MQPEAVRLVRPVHDVLQVLPHELEQLLEHLLNLRLLERPHVWRWHAPEPGVGAATSTNESDARVLDHGAREYETGSR